MPSEEIVGQKEGRGKGETVLPSMGFNKNKVKEFAKKKCFLRSTITKLRPIEGRP